MNEKQIKNPINVPYRSMMGAMQVVADLAIGNANVTSFDLVIHYAVYQFFEFVQIISYH